MAIDYQGIVAHGLAAQIAGKIREAILEGRLKVDERLPTEHDLANRFGVSRPTIREALKRLAAQNLIRSRRGPTGGTFVNEPSGQEARLAVANAASLLVSLGEFSLQDIAEARTELELVCCRLAACNPVIHSIRRRRRRSLGCCDRRSSELLVWEQTVRFSSHCDSTSKHRLAGDSLAGISCHVSSALLTR